MSAKAEMAKTKWPETRHSMTKLLLNPKATVTISHILPRQKSPEFVETLEFDKLDELNDAINCAKRDMMSRFGSRGGIVKMEVTIQDDSATKNSR